MTNKMEAFQKAFVYNRDMVFISVYGVDKCYL